MVVHDVLPAGDPARGAVGGGDPAIETLSEMGDHETTAAASAKRRVKAQEIPGPFVGGLE
jgi:hypothetical protein